MRRPTTFVPLLLAWIGLASRVVDTIFFVIMGVPLPLLWGLLAFLLSCIPVIGFWLAVVPPTILAFLESGPIVALIVFVGIVLISGFVDEVLKPKFMGKGARKPPSNAAEEEQPFALPEQQPA